MLMGMAASAQNTVMNELENSADAKTFLNVVQNLNGNVYLGFPELTVTAIIPTDKAMMEMVDVVPSTDKKYMWSYNLDASKSAYKQLSASIYECTQNENGEYVKASETIAQQVASGFSNSAIKNRMNELFKNSLIKGKLQSGKKYYETMGNTFVRIEQNGGSYEAYGSAQANANKGVTLSAKETDNGTILYADKPLLTAYNNVSKVLSQHEEFSEFLSVLKCCETLTYTDPIRKYYAAQMDHHANMMNNKFRGVVGAEDTESNVKSLYLVDNYNYTIYAPTNDAMKMAYKAGLPSPDDVEKAMEEDEAAGIDSYYDLNSKTAKLKEVLLNFVKYHVQEKSIFVDNGFESGSYSTAKFRYIEGSDGKYTIGNPYRLKVDVSSSAIKVTDAMGNTRNVITNGNCYNLMANEYWYSGSSSSSTTYTEIVKSGFAVIHAIDGPLFYNTSEQFTYKYCPVSQ